jgi:SigmaK-factor processing regulatory protein BofA.
MLEGLTKVTIRIILATAIILIINTFGQYFEFMVPINFINISLISGFGALGIIAVILFRFLI